MAPKRSNQPGAISQMYTSLASPDNRSVVTAVAFFAKEEHKLQKGNGSLRDARGETGILWLMLSKQD
ncbi:unnamed protein product [Aureobasidium vineae]|uniref:Uncharacterized protein n=1 Tax=Aureobasidium vineae TaxID=2773715 RepID=A0A9N8JYR0_9PEZI|nr:unnamed protein product [Aureobasidium vineae]